MMVEEAPNTTPEGEHGPEQGDAPWKEALEHPVPDDVIERVEEHIERAHWDAGAEDSSEPPDPELAEHINKEGVYEQARDLMGNLREGEPIAHAMRAVNDEGLALSERNAQLNAVESYALAVYASYLGSMGDRERSQLPQHVLPHVEAAERTLRWVNRKRKKLEEAEIAEDAGYEEVVTTSDEEPFVASTDVAQYQGQETATPPAQEQESEEQPREEERGPAGYIEHKPLQAAKREQAPEDPRRKRKIATERKTGNPEHDEKLDERRRWIGEAFAADGRGEEDLVSKEQVTFLLEENLRKGRDADESTPLGRRDAARNTHKRAELFHFLEEFKESNKSLRDLVDGARTPSELKRLKALSAALLEPTMDADWNSLSEQQKRVARLGEYLGLEVERRLIEASGGKMKPAVAERAVHRYEGVIQSDDLPDVFKRRFEGTLENVSQRYGVEREQVQEGLAQRRQEYEQQRAQQRAAEQSAPPPAVEHMPDEKIIGRLERQVQASGSISQEHLDNFVSHLPEQLDAAEVTVEAAQDEARGIREFLKRYMNEGARVSANYFARRAVFGWWKAFNARKYQPRLQAVRSQVAETIEQDDVLREQLGSQLALLHGANAAEGAGPEYRQAPEEPAIADGIEDATREARDRADRVFLDGVRAWRRKHPDGRMAQWSREHKDPHKALIRLKNIAQLEKKSAHDLWYELAPEEENDAAGDTDTQSAAA